jgi:hypothetical protein
VPPSAEFWLLDRQNPLPCYQKSEKAGDVVDGTNADGQAEFSAELVAHFDLGPTLGNRAARDHPALGDELKHAQW